MGLRDTTITELKKLGITDAQVKKLVKLNAVKPKAMATKLDTMGFDPKAVAKLPANVQKLTKADLMSLGGWGTTKLTPAASKLSVTDVQRIKDVLGKGPGGIGINPAALTINCCCCPCCCAVTVTEPVLISKTRSVLLS